MKNPSPLLLGILLLAASVYAEPSVTIVANSIDLALNAGYIDNLRASGINSTTIAASELPSHKEDPNIYFLGGQNAPEGIGKIVGDLLTDSEKSDVTASHDAKTIVIIANQWAPHQKVMIFAGYEKEQTRKAFGDAQGDVMKSLRFSDSNYPQNNTAAEAAVPPLDATQPFTEITAQEAYAITKNVPDLKIIDVRGAPLYDAGHIPGAVNMPVRELTANVGTLSKDTTYLLYCGGNSESIKAGTVMASEGFKKIYRLVDGYMAWRKAGYPREVTK